jgi:hypothetical protein
MTTLLKDICEVLDATNLVLLGRGELSVLFKIFHENSVVGYDSVKIDLSRLFWSDDTVRNLCNKSVKELVETKYNSKNQLSLETVWDVYVLLWKVDRCGNFDTSIRLAMSHQDSLYEKSCVDLLDHTAFCLFNKKHFLLKLILSRG